MIHTIIAKYVGTVSRKNTDGQSVPYHKFEAVLIVRPIAREHVYAELTIPTSDTQLFTAQDKGQLLAVTGNLTENALDQLVMGQVLSVLPAERVNVDDDPKKQRYDTYHRLRTTPKS